MTDVLSRVLPPKPTDKEIEEGKPKRDAFREQVSTLQTQLEQSANGFKELQLQSAETQLQTTVKKASAWLEANVEVTKRQVDAEQTRFQEEIQKQVAAIQKQVPIQIEKIPESVQKTISTSIFIPQVKTTIQKTVETLRQKADKLAKQAQQNLENRDISQDFQDIGDLFAKYGGRILMVILALRVGAFAANASLHEPVGIRILNFLYTALFFPIFILYYGFFEIRHFLWPKECEALRVESMLPIYGYAADKNPLNFADRIFGFPETESLLQEIAKKKAIIEQRRLDVLKISQLAELSK